MTLQTNNPLLLRDFFAKDATATTLTFPKPQPSPAVEGAAGYSQSPPPFPLSRALVSYYSRSDATAIADHAGTTRLPPPPRTRASPSVHGVEPSLAVEAFDVAYDNINAFHAAQRIPEKEIENMKGVRCKRIARCIASVGLYVPGGTAVLPSTALMLSVPAQIVRCKTIVLATPPGRDGSICKEVLYCAKKAGVTHILKAGGAQAISAMAWGTSSCPKVEKIFGPGNQYVTAAKMILQNSEAMVSIDMPAGPSEVLVIADRHANPIHIAVDLLSQAEHGPDSQVVLVIAGDGVNVDAILAETGIGYMEELSRQLGASGRSVAAGSDLFYLPSTAPTSSPAAAAFYGREGDHNGHHNNNYYPDAAYLHRPPSAAPSQGEISAVAEDSGVKAKIMSHPQYSALIAAYIDCQKVGAPPDVAARLSGLSRELESRLSCRRETSDDPELDQFMALSNLN
ncbi:hypothetical protein ZIOFF_052862 [Zingiber officinale]|uniref:KNOX1 domain-containing protein n=1 Tax=Zingiber officinale TaxID=94328 RepID=A0A8J5FCE4_ZINOF|nr:hypothetical protein ZIOFF_052862 [Zingiber officinale]